MKKIDEKQSLLTISDYGLGISCFTRKSKSKCVANETAILRIDSHILKLKLGKITNEKLQKPYEFCNGSIPLENVSILIRATKNPSLLDCQKYLVSGSFDRKSDTQNAQDLRWIPHIEGKEFSNARLSPIKNHGIQLTKLVVENALFYCRSLSVAETDIFQRSKDKTNNLSNLQKTKFGKVGIETGAIIDADEIEIKIVQGENVLDEQRIVKEPNTRFFLTIENDCESPIDRSEGDFDIYYKLLDGHGRIFNLGQISGDEVQVEQVKSEGTGHGNKHFCGRSFVKSKSSVDYLFTNKS